MVTRTKICTLILYLPLLRSASIPKFMVGYEMLAGPQRDILPRRPQLLSEIFLELIMPIGESRRLR